MFREHGMTKQSSERLIRGRYRLIAELAAGGMGITYRAWDTLAGIPVVVKMPQPKMLADGDALARFAREIDAMRAVPHVSIVPITDSGEDDGCPFVVMRFLPGGSLADYRRRDESGVPIKNPPGMLHFWLPGVAAALDHIHSRGMLHRDVKPGNIFLDGFLRPFLGDFGIAKVLDESRGLPKELTLTTTSMFVGTPEYMAPEYCDPRAQVGGAADQYALAVTVYEMLAGEKPFTGSAEQIIGGHLAVPVPPLEGHCPGLPKSLCAAVHRALSKQPESRFASCGQFAAAALVDLAALDAEADTARLLCPNCRSILKLSWAAAGKKGRCPKCRAAMDVANDLGSLWLESEERGETTTGAPAPGPPDAAPRQPVPATTAPPPPARAASAGPPKRKAAGSGLQPSWSKVAAAGDSSRALVGGFPWAESSDEAAGPEDAVSVAAPAPGVGGPPAAVVGRGLSGVVLRPAVQPPDAKSADRPFAERMLGVLRHSPAFSVSLSLHCLLLILLAMWVVREPAGPRLRLSLSFGSALTAGQEAGSAPTPTENSDSDETEKTVAIEPPAETDDMAETISDVPPQVAATAEAEVGPAPAAASQPAVGRLLAGRDAGRRQALLAGGGGNDATETAVTLALEWLERRQGKDGLWSLQAGYQDGSKQENRLAATAMALLALQGAGNTATEGRFKGAVAKAWRALLKAQQPDGSFDVGPLPNLHAMYSHAQATIALCELYGMTRDPDLAEPAARAIGYCVAAQGPTGGWKYEPGKGGDMSVTGWFMLALKSGEMAGLPVPAETFARLAGFLDTVALAGGSRYGYQRNSPLKPAAPETGAVTAEGLLSRQYLGWPRNEPRLVEGVEILVERYPLDFEREKDVYAWYYITQVTHHMGGDPWQRWNAQLREVLPREQVKTGPERGSWDPSLDRWGSIGGRLFMTCFCTYMLEVYYRHLPLYAEGPAAGE